MKCSLTVSIGLAAYLFGIPTYVSAFLASSLLPFKPQSLLGARTRTTASLPQAVFVPPWPEWTVGSPVVSEAALELQQKLRQLCADSSVENRGDRIKELAKELNALNPTRRPALSPSLEGKWKLLYSDIPGPSGGRVGPFLADVFQEIRAQDKRIVNILEFGPAWGLRGALEADVEVLDAKTWALVFDFVRGTFAGAQVQYKKFDESTERRIWRMTYLDEGFRVLYGRQESMSEDEAFIFVMERHDFKKEGGGVV